MATLIPAINSCLSRMSPGERRFAQRLEQKLEQDYLLWYDVPIGAASAHPDFVILHPRRGVLILEVKDWRLDSMRGITRQDVTLLLPQGLKRKLNPMEQARQHAHAVIDMLEKDTHLTFSSGRLQGRLMFPWSYGVVLTGISRQQFERAEMGAAMDEQRVLCQDEIAESVDAEAFQRRLWEMFPLKFHAALSLPQLDRIRWHIFPEIRLPPRQGTLFDSDGGTDAQEDVPELVRVMDLQQEQLARSLGDGHRVIHGVAGSGKTMILGYRARHLARICAKPVLVLCYNRTLASRLRRWMEASGIADKVLVHTFHHWCRAQLLAYHIGLPPNRGDDAAWFDEMIECVIRAVERRQIPGGQYEAVLIDEGHDFRPEWLKLVVQMVDPRTNSLLVLYDDAQSIYEREKKRKFSFRSVGIQAAGRSTILRVNYRNTREVLDVASSFARDLLRDEKADEDGVPLLAPMSAGLHGPQPLVVKLPTPRDEALFVLERLRDAHKRGTAWGNMAVIYREYEPVGREVLATLRSGGIPVTYFKDARFDKDEDTVKVLTMHSCKGLEFPLVLIPGLRPAKAEQGTEQQEARLLYVAMTRATRELVVSGVA
jgi:hypothetical protein